MDPDLVRAARAVADHGILFLGLGIALLGVALAVTLLAASAARRYRAQLWQYLGWFIRQAGRIPVLGPVMRRAGAVVPTSYVALHLVLGLVATAAVLGFAIIAEETVAGRMVATFDVAVADALRESTSPGWQQTFRTLTWFGSGEVLVIASAIIAAVLLLRRHYVLAAGWVIAQAGSSILNATLKNAFERTRPEFVDPGLVASGWSFPSGHAMGTFVFCGIGAYLLLRFKRSLAITAVVIAIAFAWSLVMGFTRLYLTVHFVSDVVAGLIAATAWVAVCISGFEIGLRRFPSTTPVKASLAQDRSPD